MQAGDVFEGRYRIEHEVGRGSFGIVYAAADLTANEQVAIKVLLPWTRDNESLRHRLKREARLTRMLNSPHAVQIHDCTETAGGEFYISMELLSGEVLSTVLLREGRLQPQRAAEIARQTLEALAESHHLGVIHRDLKPHNIFLCGSGAATDFIKVLDFGIAKVTGTEDGSGLSETTRLTSPGGVLGTPQYMSPEQCRGESLTPASDFYSLGIVLYEMVAGHVPFDDKNPVQVLVKHNTDPLPPLPSNVAGTPLGRAILRALEKMPTARFASAAEFLAALEGRPTASGPAASAASPPIGTVPQVAPPQQSIAPVPTQQSGTSVGQLLRRNWIALLIATLLIVLAICYLYR